MRASLVAARRGRKVEWRGGLVRGSLRSMNDITRIEIGVQAPALFSVEEFQRMVDTGVFEGSRVELVEGVPVRMSPAMPRHIRIQRQVFRDLDGIFGDGIGGVVAAFEYTVRFAERTLRDIDVAVVRSLEGETYFAPDMVLLAAEVSSTTLYYDLNDKRTEYALGGIPTYWVIDVNGERVHVMTNPIDGDYTARHLVPFGEPLTVPGANGATVTVR